MTKHVVAKCLPVNPLESLSSQKKKLKIIVVASFRIVQLDKSFHVRRAGVPRTHTATHLSGRASSYWPCQQSLSRYNTPHNTGDVYFGPVMDACVAMCQIRQHAECWKQMALSEQRIWVTACSRCACEDLGEEERSREEQAADLRSCVGRSYLGHWP